MELRQGVGDKEFVDKRRPGVSGGQDLRRLGFQEAKEFRRPARRDRSRSLGRRDRSQVGRDRSPVRRDKAWPGGSGVAAGRTGVQPGGRRRGRELRQQPENMQQELKGGKEGRRLRSWQSRRRLKSRDRSG